jgi:hypothetical protein
MAQNLWLVLALALTLINELFISLLYSFIKNFTLLTFQQKGGQSMRKENSQKVAQMRQSAWGDGIYINFNMETTIACAKELPKCSAIISADDSSTSHPPVVISKGD